jgi:Trm5-related predicted tRNA methylase
MATKNPRVQVTVDSELEEAMTAVDAHPKSRSRLIRDLALRGAEATAEDRVRRAEAQEFLRKVASGEIDLDLTGAREAHEEREAEVE